MPNQLLIIGSNNQSEPPKKETSAVLVLNVKTSGDVLHMLVVRLSNCEIMIATLGLCDTGFFCHIDFQKNIKGGNPWKETDLSVVDINCPKDLGVRVVDGASTKQSDEIITIQIHSKIYQGAWSYIYSQNTQNNKS